MKTWDLDVKESTDVGTNRFLIGGPKLLDECVLVVEFSLLEYKLMLDIVL